MTPLDADFKPGLTVEEYRDIAARKLKEAEAAEVQARRDLASRRMDLTSLHERLNNPALPALSKREQQQQILYFNQDITKAEEAYERAKERTRHCAHVLHVYTHNK